MKPLKAFSKQLFGARYERITKSLLVCLIIFLALYAAEIKVTIAPFILFLTATALSFEVMWQGISSAGNADRMMGLFALPFHNKRFVISYLLAFGGYAFITKILPVLTIFWVIGTSSIAQIGMAVLCACNGCTLAAAWYAMSEKKHMVPIFLCVFWNCGVLLSVFFVKPLMLLGGIILTSIVAATCYLLATDVYTFYRPAPAKKLISRSRGSGNVLLYLLRYLFTNKSYLVNTVGLWAIACFLPLMLGQLEGLNAMPLGFAILCLNTPICILLSCDPALEQAIRALPGQAIRFCSRYCFFIFSVNMSTNSIYLISWQIQNGGIDSLDMVTAMLFALQSAILSVLLEWRHPIRNWKIESDLWHHPRKYVVPILMMLVSGATGSVTWAIYLLMGLLIVEGVVLALLGNLN
ncbi:hypothetical protein ABXS75_15690 [Roseburia hominis]